MYIQSSRTKLILHLIQGDRHLLNVQHVVLDTIMKYGNKIAFTKYGGAL